MLDEQRRYTLDRGVDRCNGPPIVIVCLDSQNQTFCPSVTSGFPSDLKVPSLPALSPNVFVHSPAGVSSKVDVMPATLLSSSTLFAGTLTTLTSASSLLPVEATLTIQWLPVSDPTRTEHPLEGTLPVLLLALTSRLHLTVAGSEVGPTQVPHFLICSNSVADFLAGRTHSAIGPPALLHSMLGFPGVAVNTDFSGNAMTFP